MSSIHGTPRPEVRGGAAATNHCAQAVSIVRRRSCLVILSALSLSIGGCGQDSQSPYGLILPEPDGRPRLAAGSTSLVKLSGDGQTDTALATLPEPLRVRAERSGEPVSDAVVRWYLGADPLVESVTDTDGVASAVWTLGTEAGKTSALAQMQAGGVGLDSAGGSSAVSVRFGATILPGSPVTLVMESGDGQIGIVGEPLGSPYVVGATDAYGNRPVITPDEVAWSVTRGGGSLAPCGPDCLRASQESGVVHVLGPDEGEHRASAVLGATQVVFAARGVSALVSRRRAPSAFPSFGFDPVRVTVGVGETVGWRLRVSGGGARPGSGAHDIVFEDGWAPTPGSTPPPPGSLLRTFDVPGTYRYRCTLHSISFEEGEVGEVVVRQ